MCIDSLGSIVLYFVLYLTVLDLFYGALSMKKIAVYTLACLAGVIYRILVYQKSYLLCFERAFAVTGQLRVDLANHLRKQSLEKVRKISVQIEYKMAPLTAAFSILVHFLMPLVLLGGSYLLLGGEIKGEVLIAFLIMSMAISGLLVSFEHYYIMLKDLKLAACDLEQAVDMAPLPYKDSDFTLTHFNVDFQNVGFSYDSGNQVLHDISFSSPEGSITALIGPSGSGKSIIASLIPRFWDVTEGCIRVDGRDIRELNPDRLLESVSAVFQENILLSGGEKQRIAIARAILKDSPILLLDESTASLDADNETKINMALDRLMQNKTIFVIAHRLNTIQKADQIILVNQGRIEELGNHQSLMAARGHYYEMVPEQEKAMEWIACS